MSNFGDPKPARTIGEPWPEFNDGLTYWDLLSPGDAGLSLIEYYSKKHKNSAPFQGNGSVLEYHRLPWKEPDAPYLLEILYEDDNLIALNKPSGLQVLPGGLFQQRTVLTQLQRHASKEISPCEVPNPVPVHRLGRGTSGLLNEHGLFG